MKRKLIAVLSLLVLIGCLTAFAFAENDFVTDGAGLFTASQVQELNRLASELSREHNVGLYIITMRDFKQESWCSYLGDYVDEIYHSRGLGMGSGRSGIVLALSMADRDYNVYWYGPDADAALSGGNIDSFESGFLSYFRSNDFYSGFRAYLNTCGRYLSAAENGTPIGNWSEEGEKLPAGLAAIPGAIAALLAGLGLSAPMRSAKCKTDANDYVVPGSMELRARSDMFLHRSVTRRPRETQSSSHSGGVHSHSSGGHSHGGKF